MCESAVAFGRAGESGALGLAVDTLVRPAASSLAFRHAKDRRRRVRFYTSSPGRIAVDLRGRAWPEVFDRCVAVGQLQRALVYPM